MAAGSTDLSQVREDLGRARRVGRAVLVGAASMVAFAVGGIATMVIGLNVMAPPPDNHYANGLQGVIGWVLVVGGWLGAAGSIPLGAIAGVVSFFRQRRQRAIDRFNESYVRAAA